MPMVQKPRTTTEGGQPTKATRHRSTRVVLWVASAWPRVQPPNGGARPGCTADVGALSQATLSEAVSTRTIPRRAKDANALFSSPLAAQSWSSQSLIRRGSKPRSVPPPHASQQEGHQRVPGTESQGGTPQHTIASVVPLEPTRAPQARPNGRTLEDTQWWSSPFSLSFPLTRPHRLLVPPLLFPPPRPRLPPAGWR